MPEDTPFLADNDHAGDDYDGEDGFPTKQLPANAHLKRPSKIVAAITAFLSFATGVLLIVTFILISVGPFGYTYSSTDRVRDLAIVLFVNFILSTPTIFFQIPILINIIVHIVMSIVTLVFSIQLLTHGWPDSNFCSRWEDGYYDGGLWHPGRRLPETWECRQARSVVRITTGVSAGVGILVGILLLTSLFLRVVALARTKFWRGTSLPQLKGWKPRGFTVQFTLSVLPADGSIGSISAREIAPASREEERLIET